MTTEQLNFIKSLAAQTGAYQDGEGMIVDGKLYPRLDLEAALEGAVSKREASNIIEVLLAAPKTMQPREYGITPKQYSYIRALLKKTGQSRKQRDLLELTTKEASALIDELKNA